MTGAARLGTTVLSAIVLVVVNAIPLVGVAFWGWSLMMILVLYWIESGIVGVINVFKIARAEGGIDDGPLIETQGNRITIRLSGINSMGGDLARAPIIAFFVMHYGIFWVVHGVFVFLMPLFAGLSSMTTGNPLNPVVFAPMDFGALPLDGLLLSAALLTVSHVASFFVNYLGRGEYRRVTPQGQMMSVYGRVAVLHITIVAGAFVIGLFGTPIAALFLLVGLKTLFDLVLHLREHRAASPMTA